ncbi:ribonuclease III [Mammaliicoccus stepanovicii]|uniref:Ribonuclease 3 n=1 Tax=Mammaliicoccus stepanovicii TaxID=643214 RepID=A0A239ZHN4_9STAP|nr:ribonuclease III [Mammaliicoccus stepanovicii]PNZ77978.1 ribonuclease III [Mammaliicoccus stepanovicii]GGI41747.1 ribonuclease 3 [Mammaliicoccus stepanovicii]SNV70752.1 ribonuclease III [Mammaliicoccus stepanovicii]
MSKNKSQIIAQFKSKFDKFMNNLDIEFDNYDIYVQAFSHSSFINDFKLDKLSHNERLEFLGDAVLELTVSQFLFKKFPLLPEGKLTKLRASIVCEPSLVTFAMSLNMNDLLLLGKGEEKTGGRERPSLIADAFESFVGALYLDKGLDTVETFLSAIVYPQVIDESYTANRDYKTELQELMHRRNKGTITYNLLDESGPAHHKLFTSEVLLDGKPLETGEGRTKKESEQNAAKKALNNSQ